MGRADAADRANPDRSGHQPFQIQPFHLHSPQNSSRNSAVPSIDLHKPFMLPRAGQARPTIHEGVWRMRISSLLDWTDVREPTQAEASEILGINARAFQRW